MDVILVKILAAFLALSQVATRPQAIRTEFVETRDQAEVVGLLRDGCAHMRKAFDIESIDLDGLIATALDDPQAELTGASCAPFLQHIEERSAAKETKTYIPQIMW